MEILQSIFIWLVIGVWICYKRNWYKHLSDYNGDSTPNFVCGCAILFSPIALLIALFDVFVKSSWKKDK
jgi:hypothetical protein